MVVWRCSIKMWIGNAINLSVWRYLEQQMSVNKLYNMLSTLFSSSLSRAKFIPETLPAGAAKSKPIYWTDRKGRVRGNMQFSHWVKNQKTACIRTWSLQAPKITCIILRWSWMYPQKVLIKSDSQLALNCCFYSSRNCSLWLMSQPVQR